MGAREDGKENVIWILNFRLEYIGCYKSLLRDINSGEVTAGFGGKNMNLFSLVHVNLVFSFHFSGSWKIGGLLFFW